MPQSNPSKWLPEQLEHSASIVEIALLNWVRKNCKFAMPVKTPVKRKPKRKAPKQFSYPPIESDDPDVIDDDASNRAETYFNIGHTDDFYNVHESDPKTHVVWVLLGRDEIATAPGNKTHGMVWGHDYSGKTWKGRYEGDTGRLSVAGPGAYSQAPSWLMDLLEQKFGFISEVHSF